MATEVAPPAQTTTARGGFLSSVLHPERRGSTHRTEFVAGLTTFVTMSYIIFVNASIMLGTPEHPTGLNFNALVIGTIFAAVVPTLFMGLWADLPWALAPGMGYNALFAYTVVGGRGIPTGAALALVLLDGVAFLLLVSGPWRESIIKGIPLSIKLAAGAGIGLFIAYIGFLNATLINFNAGVPALSSLGNPVAVIALIGVVITALLMAWRVRGALLIGILATAAVAWFTAVWKPGTRAALLGATANPKGLSDFISLPNLGEFLSKRGTPDFGLLANGHIASGALILFFLTFLVTDMMDSFGTFSGLASKLGILGKDGNFPRSGRALIVDAAAGIWGPITGTATVATFIESASGESEGGKTGLTSVWVAIFFLLALFVVPFIGLVPAVATAPALIVVGFMMIEPVVRIGFQDITEGLPAFLAILTMPITYSIADGMFFGVVTYVILKIATGRVREVSWVMWAFAILLLIAKLLDAFGL